MIAKTLEQIIDDLDQYHPFMDRFIEIGDLEIDIDRVINDLDYLRDSIESCASGVEDIQYQSIRAAESLIDSAAYDLSELVRLVDDLISQISQLEIEYKWK